jgi:UDP-N-acetylglucosamine 3-dehydrogenase
MEPVAVILFGAGKMGRHHLRVAQQNRAFRVVAIVDPALSGGRLDGVPVVSSLAETNAEAAIVATPTPTHTAVAFELIDRGIDMLVEKPLATEAAECDAIATRAGARGVRVAVGHTERFNPAVRALSMLPLGDVERVELVRVGCARRCDVLHELAVHDLDLLERIAGRATLRNAITTSSANDEMVDAADLNLVTERGAEASIRVSAFGERVRRITIHATLGCVEVDLLTPSVRLGDHTIPIDREEPLAAQLTAFRAFLAGLPSDVCRIDEATRSVELATHAREEARSRIARQQRLGQVSRTSFSRSDSLCQSRSRRPPAK